MSAFAESEDAIQSFGALLAIEATQYRVHFASANAQDVFGLTLPEIFDADLAQLLSQKLVHAIRNAQSRPNFTSDRSLLGQFDINEKTYTGFASGSNGHVILELEPGPRLIDPASDILKTLSYLIGQLEKCETEQVMLERLTTQLRHLSGFERVMACKFDEEFNTSVFAESCGSQMQTMLGTRNQSNLPERVRAQMISSPIRCVADVDYRPVSIIAAQPSDTPPDIIHAHLRGVSELQINVLKSMSAKSSMTLSLVVDDALWGMLVFHSSIAQPPPINVRQVLSAFRPVLQLQLSTLRLKARLRDLGEA